MVIKIGDFEIYGYDANHPEQRHLTYVLNNDLDFRKYVTKKLDERLTENIDNTSGGGLQYEHSYLVKYKDNFVGYIRLEDLKINGVLHIQCAVSPEFRNQKLGEKMMRVISDYILEHYEKVKKLRGVIERNNYASRALAEKIGFQEEKRDDSYIYVTKGRL